jgi:hypothetical protein
MLWCSRMTRDELASDEINRAEIPRGETPTLTRKVVPIDLPTLSLPIAGRAPFRLDSIHLSTCLHHNVSISALHSSEAASKLWSPFEQKLDCAVQNSVSWCASSPDQRWSWMRPCSGLYHFMQVGRRIHSALLDFVLNNADQY